MSNSIHVKNVTGSLAQNDSANGSDGKKDSGKYSSFVPESNTRESKSLLARLLASEGMSVVHSPEAKTASFDVKNRTLILPSWRGMTNELYDMFVGHEVGHALFTPYDHKRETESNHTGPWCVDAQEIGGDKYGEVAQGYLNVVEDARIERMMKEKFPGLRRDFVVAYDELLSNDFFKLKENPNMTRLFIDRANLYFKISVSGQHELNIDFSEKEKVLLDRMANTKTFEDVVQLTKDIFEYEREEAKKRAQMAQDKSANQVCNDPSEDEKVTAMLMSQTENLIHSRKSECKELTGSYRCYILPEPDLKKMIFTSENVQELISNRHMVYNWRAQDSIYGYMYEHYKNCMEKLALHIMNQNKKSVEILVKQFEMKKAASAHKRQLTSKSGRLDMEKIIHYRYNDDLFCKNLILRKGKNHGFVLFIDWSGSMGSTIGDVLRHSFMIAQFCKKCNIPFVVYAFSDREVRKDLYDTRRELASLNGIVSALGSHSPTGLSDHQTNDESVWIWPKDSNGVEIETNETERRASVSELNLIEICSSRMSKSEMVSAYANLLGCITMGVSCQTIFDGTFRNEPVTIHGCVMPEASIRFKEAMSSYGIDKTSYLRSMSSLLYNFRAAFSINGLDLGGTPLDEAVWASNYVVNQFRKENRVEVMNTIFLTDGQGSQIFRVPNSYAISSSGKSSSAEKCMLKTKNNIHDALKVVDPSLYFKGAEDGYSFTFRILLQLHKQYTGAKTMGIFVTTGKKNAYCGTHSLPKLLGMEETSSAEEKRVEEEMNKIETLSNGNYTKEQMKRLDELELIYEKDLENQAKQFERELENLSSKNNTNAFRWKKEGYVVFNGIGNSRIKGSICGGESNPLNPSSRHYNDWTNVSAKAKLEIVSPYDVLYCIRSDFLEKLPENSIDKLETGSTVTAIKRAFTSQLKSSAMNKTLLMKIASSISGEI